MFEQDSASSSTSTDPAPSTHQPRMSASTRSTPQQRRRPPREEQSVPMRNRFQEEHQRMLRVESNLVRRVVDGRGAAGFGYKCLKCGTVKLGRLRAIGHASNCGKKKTGKKRGKSTRALHCNLCEVTATTVKKLSQHRREVHGQVLKNAMFQCTHCLQTFSHIGNYKKHLDLHKRERGNFSCKFCPLSFKHLRSLDRHKLSHLGTEPRFPCASCGKVFSHLFDMKRHAMSHQGPGVRFKCTQCTMEFTRQDSLRRHEKKKHLENSESPMSRQVAAEGGEGGVPVPVPVPVPSDIIEVLRSTGYDEEDISRIVEKAKKLPIMKSVESLTSSSSASTPSVAISTTSKDSSPHSPGPSSAHKLDDSSSPLDGPSTADDPSPISGSTWDKFVSPFQPSPSSATSLKQDFVCEICGDSRDSFRDSYDLNRHVKNMHGPGCHKLYEQHSVPKFFQCQTKLIDNPDSKPTIQNGLQPGTINNRISKKERQHSSGLLWLALFWC